MEKWLETSSTSNSLEPKKTVIGAFTYILDSGKVEITKNDNVKSHEASKDKKVTIPLVPEEHKSNNHKVSEAFSLDTIVQTQAIFKATSERIRRA